MLNFNMEFLLLNLILTNINLKYRRFKKKLNPIVNQIMNSVIIVLKDKCNLNYTHKYDYEF